MTAVDWLFTTLDNILELYPSEWSKVSKAVEEAKQKEKEQIIEAVMYGDIRGKLETYMTAEEYYNETYNK
jgi:hypothetical protein